MFLVVCCLWFLWLLVLDAGGGVTAAFAVGVVDILKSSLNGDQVPGDASHSTLVVIK